MTPGPDPPVPTTKTVYVKGATTLNNSRMFRLVDMNTNTVLDGGKVVINQFTDWTLTIPDGSDYYLVVKAQGYNNSHPDYTDTFYDNASVVNFNGVGYIVIGSNQADGSTLTVTQTDTTVGSYSWS